MHSLFDGVKAATSIRPQPLSAGIASGLTIDKLGSGNPATALLVLEVGATTGAPASFTVDAKIQDSLDGVGFADVAGAAIPTVTAANIQALLRVDNLATLRRYVRVVVTPAFVGGAAPTVQASAHLLLGRANNEPLN